MQCAHTVGSRLTQAERSATLRPSHRVYILTCLFPELMVITRQLQKMAYKYSLEEASQTGCSRGTGDVARGRGEQAQRRAGLVADATRLLILRAKPAARTVGRGEGWEAQG
jgi:hypothetical protein